MAYDVNIENLQKALAALGFDPGGVDGKNGPKTRAAAAAFAAAGAGPAAPAAPASGQPSEPAGASKLPAAGEGKLAGVKPALAAVVRAASLRSPVPFTVIEGVRSRERQAQLVKAGASKTMSSKHITGDAVDLWPIGTDGKNLPSDAAFPRGSAAAEAADKALWDGLRAISKVMKEVAAERGVKLTWGGDWKSFPDGPHFQLEL